MTCLKTIGTTIEGGIMTKIVALDNGMILLKVVMSVHMLLMSIVGSNVMEEPML